tara:strand:+ start:39 stop:446 length:408 start_codon:yes stop_codon:yes gene_type:complete
MEEALLDLAAESVFCSEPVENRLAESLSASTTLVLATVGLFTSIFSVLWWNLPAQTRGDLPKWAGLVFPIFGVTAGYLGTESSNISAAETFEAAYKMKCNYCMDDERCESLYGIGWECVEGECMETADDDDEEDN